MSPMCSVRWHGWAHLVLVLLAPAVCSAQFGGGDYSPPAPVCEKFQCSAGMKAAGNADHKLWSYGCQDSGLNVMNMADMKGNPLGGMGGMGGMNKGKNVDKCCVERDICKQTCGTTSVQCHDNFQACTKKVCKGDQNCNLAAMMSDFRSDPEDLEEPKKDPNEKYDYEKERKQRECRGYEHAQKAACVCVPDEDWQLTTDSNLKAFYRKHNPEKLDDSGEIKDVEEVWKKWKGKEPQMFQALSTKYKAKAVTIKTKPKPPPYTPPPPLSKEEQKKEDERMAENRKKWKLEDDARDKENAKKDKENAERKRRRAEEKDEEARRRAEEADGETVEL